MGKSFKFTKKNLIDHVPDEQQLADRDWKHLKAKQKKGTRSPSNKDLNGHFNQQHVWPVTNTKKKGRQKI